MAEQGSVEQIPSRPTFPPSYAERLASVETYVANLATKTDVAELRTEVVELKIEVVTSRAEAKADNAALRDELKADNAASREELKTNFSASHGELRTEYTASHDRLWKELTDFRNEFIDFRSSTKTALRIIQGLLLLLYAITSAIGIWAGLALR